MSPLATVANTLFSIGALFVLALALAIFIGILFWRRGTFVRLVGKFARTAALLASGAAPASSLFYSEILHYPPCVLCWTQRALIYPQFLLFLFINKIPVAKRYIAWRISLGLSSLGFLVALYHYYIEQGGGELFECAAFGPSCTSRFVYEFGFVTIPFMSLALFGLLVVLYFARRSYLKSYPQENAGVSN